MTTNAVRRLLLALAAPVLLLAGAPTSAPAGAVTTPPDLRLNQVQVVGSHNSYKITASPEETAIRRAAIGDADDLMQYTHAPLPEQLSEQAVRQIELDVFRDDEGGKYAEPLLRQVAGHGPHDPAMQEPGTKVLHVQDVDYRSTCLSLVACLEAVEAWSDAHPDHLPIAILLELKDSPLELGDLEFVVPDPWTAEAMDALDDEIRSVVPADEVITPDDVRGGAATLEGAVTGDGWPTVEESRGKVLFLMDNGGSRRTDYLDGHPSLEGRVMFTNSTPGQADAAFVKVNQPRGNVGHIQGLVEAGYVVRTRADADTIEAREGDTSGREAAFESGAQWVSTDYPVPEYAAPFGTGYVVQVPGGTIARCNPVTAPPGCVSGDIEPAGEADPGPYVDLLYQTLLGRPADAAGRAHWVASLAAGARREDVAGRLTASPEANHGHNVELVYRTALGRGADPAARDFWGARLDAGEPLGRVQVGVLASAEAHARAGGTDAGWVDALYRAALGRGADVAGRDHFVARLAAGQTRSTVARAVLLSAEGRRTAVDAVTDGVLGRSAAPSEHEALGTLLRTTFDVRTVAVAVISTHEAYARATAT